MKLSTVAIALTAALALTGCKKKPADDHAAPPTTATGSGTAAGTATPPTPTPVTGEALARIYLAGWDAWNAGDKAKFGAMYAKDAVSHWPDNPTPERRGGPAIVDEAFHFRAGFPDARSTAQLVLVNGRTVAGVWLTTGTNTGAMPSPMGEMPPTGKKIGQLLFHMVTFDDANQIADEWFIMDGNTMMNQLGMSPQPGRPIIEQGAATPVIVASSGAALEQGNLVAAQKGNDDFNKRDLAALTEGWTDDAIESDQASPADTVGKAKIAAGTKMFMDAFSDGKITPISLWAAGDYVVGVSTFTGTNDGDMGPMKKTGKPVKLTVAEISKLDGGKVKQLWRFFDSTAMAIQMGMMAPPPGAPPATK
ncbi:MAG: ester cyclase [Myxococcales bacterium]|nr:ester cyclase [Myxococcales bacterium]